MPKAMVCTLDHVGVTLGDTELTKLSERRLTILRRQRTEKPSRNLKAPPRWNCSALRNTSAPDARRLLRVAAAVARVLLLDRLGDHRRVGRQGAGVVGDHQRAALV